MDLRNAVWEDHPQNPLIEPPGREWLVADPSVLTPDQTPDGHFHLFAWTVRGIHHYRSGDGIQWEKQQGKKRLFRGMRPFVFYENGYHLFYERFISPRKTSVAVRSSSDLYHWSEPRTVLKPSFPWEGHFFHANGNPCVVKHEGKYRLYYSASWIWLPDCKFTEPLHIAVAESDLLLGPYTKRPEPIISPNPSVYWCNFGAGSIKVLPPKNGAPWIAFQNGIYKDQEGKSRSEIHVLESEDGLHFTDANDNKPILAPEPGWKTALVYAMCVAFHEDRALMYYNARDGWFRGTERIGMATAKIG